MIRFVLAPDGDGRGRPQAQASRPRRLDHGDPRRRCRRRWRARRFRAVLGATCGSRPIFATATERLLERAALDALAIAHKAGSVVAGFSKVEAALAVDSVAGLLHASDGAPDGNAQAPGSAAA